MKLSFLAVVLISVAGPAMAQATSDQHQPGTRKPMEQMMQGQGMPGGMMGAGRMGRPGRGGMGRFSNEDIDAFLDAHIAAIHAGLKLTADQEKLWPPVETAIRNLANLHLGHMRAMHQAQGMIASDPIGLLRGMADHMSQGADTMRKLADAASPLYAALDNAQRRRLQVLVHMDSRARQEMMGSDSAMMPGGSDEEEDDNGDGHGSR